MATYFWIGTSGGTWDTVTTTNWATSSGGSGGAGVPGSADTATFDGNSGANTITTSGTISITAMTLNTGFTGIVKFGGAFTTSGATVVNQGTLNTNGQTCTWNGFTSSGSGIRVITLGASAISLTGSWNTSTTTNLTISANTATITVSGASITWAAGNASVNGASIILNCTGTTSFTETGAISALTYAPTSGTTNNLTLGSNLTVSGTLTLTGAAAPNTPLVSSSSLGTARPITCNGTVTLTGRMDFRDITGAGTATWSLTTSGGDGQGNSGITFATAQTNYYKGTAAASFSTAANWFLATNGGGGAGRVPFPQDTAVFDVNSGAFTYTFDTGRIGTLTCTGFTGTVSISLNINCYGSWTSGSGMTLTGGSTILFYGRSALGTITNATKAWGGSVQIFSAGGTYTLQDNLFATSGNLYLEAGTFAANGNNVSTGTFIATTTTGLAMTLSMGSGTWNITGNSGILWTNVASLLTIVPSTATIIFTTTGSSTITTAALTMPSFTMNGVGTLTLTDGYTCGSTTTVTLTQGTLNTNGQTCSWGAFISTSGTTRTLTLGASAITITGTAVSAWNTGSISNLTFTANTATITFTGTGGGMSAGALTFNAVTFNGTGSCQLAVSSANTTSFGSLTYAPTSGTGSVWTITNGSFTVTSALTLTGASAPNVPLVCSLTLGTQYTITCNGTLTLTGRMDFRDIKGGGTATWNFSTNGGDCQGNANISFATAQSNYWVGATGAYHGAGGWASSSGGTGGTGRVSYPQDTTILDSSSGSGTISCDVFRIGNFNATGFTGTIAISFITCQFYGNLSFGSTATLTGNQLIYLMGRGSQTVGGTGIGVIYPSTIELLSVGGTYTQNANFGGNVVNFVLGTWTANGFNMTSAVFEYIGSSGTTINMGSGNWYILNSVSGQTCWNFGSTAGLTLNCQNSTIVLQMSAAVTGTWTFQGGGFTYYNLSWVFANTGAQVLQMAGANTFNSYNATITSIGARTITWAASVTQTVTSSLTLAGTASNVLTINSSLSGTYGTLSCPLGAVISVTNVSVKDNRAFGTAAPFYATGKSTIVSNAPNWSLVGGLLSLF